MDDRGDMVDVRGLLEHANRTAHLLGVVPYLAPISPAPAINDVADDPLETDEPTAAQEGTDAHVALDIGIEDVNPIVQRIQMPDASHTLVPNLT